MKPRNVRRGAALVEFALISLAAYILIAGGVELGRMIFVSQVLQDASRVAARELAVTPLLATDPFETALGEPEVLNRIWNPNLLVIDLTCAAYQTDAGLESYWASLPVVNRALRPVFIAETVDLGAGGGGVRRIMRYPGALLKLSTPPANPCPATYDPITNGTGSPTDLSVAIPRVTYDATTGQESGYSLVPIIAEVRCDPDAANTPATDTTSPFRLDGTAPANCSGYTPGIVTLSINYPFQSAMLSFFHNNPNGPLEPNIANRIQADDTFAGNNEPALPAGESFADPQAAAPGSSLYTGPLGLGTQYAWAEKVRPYRNLITGQAIYRREVFQ